jgi:hypothetical protein
VFVAPAAAAAELGQALDELLGDVNLDRPVPGPLLDPGGHCLERAGVGHLLELLRLDLHHELEAEQVARSRPDPRALVVQASTHLPRLLNELQLKLEGVRRQPLVDSRDARLEPRLPQVLGNDDVLVVLLIVQHLGSEARAARLGPVASPQPQHQHLLL